jgi:alpha-1,3-glucan synthase
MLSQLSKTIKLALKSTEEERAILRARSAVQRFPVVEWRQRMEDMHRRSIHASRRLAASNAWREADCGTVPSQHVIPETEDWNPVNQGLPVQPDWDAQSAMSSPRLMPSSPGQWSPLSTPNDETFLTAPPRFGLNRDSSYTSDTSDEEHSRHSVATSSRPGYSDFLEKANKTIAQDHRHAPDPFLSPTPPARPFGSHSRVASMESIGSIVEEKSNSPLNKAIATVCILRILVTAIISFPFFLVHGFRWRCCLRVRTKVANLELE